MKTRKGPEANRSHVDIWVHDLDRGIAEIEAIGGTLKLPPSIYPRPGSFPGERPTIDWSVMRDPFGNEFCLVHVLSPAQVDGVEAAARDRDPRSVDDAFWRAAAGLTGSER